MSEMVGTILGNVLVFLNDRLLLLGHLLVDQPLQSFRNVQQTSTGHFQDRSLEDPIPRFLTDMIMNSEYDFHGVGSVRVTITVTVLTMTGW